MVVRLAHVCIETADLEATEAFYGYLGITRRFEFRNHQDELVGMYLYFGEDTFIEVIKVREARPEGAVRHFAIEVEDVDATRAVLFKNDVEVTDKETGGDNTLMITCHDPNGIFIELQQYTDASMQYNGGTCRVDYQP
jgi:catechol 2,3-dioxygenase-like lactoylglutathione lyase family enzyme